MGNNGIDGYTKLMLHCNGLDGSQIFIDEMGKIVTAYGNAQIDTAQYKFGGASGLFDGAGDYLSTPAHDDLRMGTGDFTIDFWLCPSAVSGLRRFITSESWGVNVNNILVRFTMSDKISGYIGGIGFAGVTPLSVDTWYHIAIVRSGTSCKVYVNGNEDASIISGSNLTEAITFIGGHPGGSEWYYGWFDEIRISKGIARWTANFTPPIKEYEVPILAISLAQII